MRKLFSQTIEKEVLQPMAKCQFCDKGLSFGIKVSHSHRRSNRTWKPNVKRVKAIVDGVEKADVLYITGEEGLNVIARDSYHAEVVDMLCNNLAVVDEPSSKGTGNEVDMEQILNWDPSIVFFAPGSIYSTVADNENWQTIPAIKDGKYYEVPFGPYNWMGFPPSVQRILGMQWMAKVLYPEAADYDMYEVTQTYFQLFYHCDLTIDQYNALVANSLPAVKAAG